MTQKNVTRLSRDQKSDPRRRDGGHRAVPSARHRETRRSRLDPACVTTPDLRFPGHPALLRATPRARRGGAGFKNERGTGILRRRRERRPTGLGDRFSGRETSRGLVRGYRYRPRAPREPRVVHDPEHGPRRPARLRKFKIRGTAERSSGLPRSRSDEIVLSDVETRGSGSRTVTRRGERSDACVSMVLVSCGGDYLSPLKCWCVRRRRARPSRLEDDVA
jgi:hypothetical protein